MSIAIAIAPIPVAETPMGIRQTRISVGGTRTSIQEIAIRIEAIREAEAVVGASFKKLSFEGRAYLPEATSLRFLSEQEMRCAAL